MPQLVRLYISQSALGFVIATPFVAAMLYWNVADLWYLATHTDAGPFAVFLLWAHLGLLCGGVQFAFAVMRMAGTEPDPAPRPQPVEPRTTSIPKVRRTRS